MGILKVRTMMRMDTGAKQDVKGQEKMGCWRLASSLPTMGAFPKVPGRQTKKGLRGRTSSGNSTSCASR